VRDPQAGQDEAQESCADGADRQQVSALPYLLHLEGSIPLPT
jgi:hypothetical protein